MPWDLPVGAAIQAISKGPPNMNDAGADENDYGIFRAGGRTVGAVARTLH
jgi:hypothetical protein